MKESKNIQELYDHIESTYNFNKLRIEKSQLFDRFEILFEDKEYRYTIYERRVNLEYGKWCYTKDEKKGYGGMGGPYSFENLIEKLNEIAPQSKYKETSLF